MVIINVFIMDGIDSPTENSYSYHMNIMNSYHRDRLTLVVSHADKSYFSKQKWDVTESSVQLFTTCSTAVLYWCK
jgi:hypothetical protein